MAQLKNSIVTGNLQVTEKTISGVVKTSVIEVPTTNGGTTYGNGTNGQVLTSNGTTVYWGTLPTGVQPSSTSPNMDGISNAGSETAYARGDHVHPTDTSRAPIASPEFTGSPTAPTASNGTNSTQIATTEFVQNALASISGAMYFMGSLGTDGTITTLPAAAMSNKGYAYKVITAGTYQSVVANAGDLLVSDGTTWVLIPSGDEPSGTVTSITLKAGGGIALDVDNTAITTSGSRTITNIGVRSIATGSNSGTITVNTNGTNAEVPVAGLGTMAYENSNAYLALSGGTMTGGITMTSGSSAFNDVGILFSNGGRIGGNLTGGLGIYGSNGVYIRPNSTSNAGTDGIEVTANATMPGNNGSENLGDPTRLWNNVFAVKYKGNAELSGAPTAPTATSGTNTTQIATTAFVTAAVTNGKPTTTTVTIATSDWSSNSATKSVTGVTASNNVFVAPDPASRSVALKAGMYCSAQGSGTLTFTVNKTPTDSVTINVMIFS